MRLKPKLVVLQNIAFYINPISNRSVPYYRCIAALFKGSLPFNQLDLNQFLHQGCVKQAVLTVQMLSFLGTVILI